MVIINEQDLGKTRIELLMDLLYEATGMRIPQQWISYGKPQELDVRPDVWDDPNTYLPVNIDLTYDARLASEHTAFLYRRRTLAEHFAGISWSFALPQFPVRMAQVVEECLNPELSYPLTIEDFVDADVPSPNVTHVTLRAHPESLFWCGSIRVPLQSIDPDWLKLVRINRLPGFVPFAEAD